jgi:phage tail sheath gpL-like
MVATLPVMPSNWLVPFFYAQVDATQAGSTTLTERALIVSQQSAAATATADTPIQVQTQEDAATLFGRGSYCHAMVKAYRDNDPFGELWVCPVADDGAAVDNTHSLTIGGPATENGTISLYIGGYLVTTTVTNGDAANTIATNMNADIVAAALENPITVAATVVPPVVTLTSVNGGAVGNNLDVRVNYLGAAGGEELPAGVTVGIVNNATGATNPTLTTALANLGDDLYDYIMHPWIDVTSTTAFLTLLEDTTGRWAPDRQIYGHAFTSAVGAVAALTAITNAISALVSPQHHTVFGFNDSPSSPWEWTAAHVGQIAKSSKALPSRPYQTLVPIGMKAPPSGVGRWSAAEKQTLLDNGVSVSAVATETTVKIDRVVSNYLTTPGGQADRAYKDVTTLYTLMRILRRLRSVIEVDFVPERPSSRSMRAACSTRSARMWMRSRRT